VDKKSENSKIDTSISDQSPKIDKGGSKLSLVSFSNFGKKFSTK
jgi:hypothetical protein